ncbi:MAG: DUF1844 domain-containing protein [Candidatus Omnitrophica bacterium]|nr:DUF1844 domain-containing protein [Candidatus Omnitrophota bacterium]MBU4487763.1 DUF1844 domain-containing protein [Candidatus Omnitrophota bacterium]MCG2705173.1 DUF1844 domain-containing protein [Candidatus Omnitrophota bacterium]
MNNEQDNDKKAMVPDFGLFISSLSMQALILLGEIDSPLTHKKEINLDQAKYVIDTIAMLKDKTQSSLTKEELSFMDNILYELRMKYTAKSGKL